MTDDDIRPSVDGPTAMSRASGHLHGGPPEETTSPDRQTEPDEPTLVAHTPDEAPRLRDEPTLDESALDGPAPVDGPIVAVPSAASADDPTITVVNDNPTTEPTNAAPSTANADDPTITVVNDDPAIGPMVGGWPFDQFEPPPLREPTWQPDAVPAPPLSGRSPAYYVGLGAAVVLVIALVALAALVTVMRPQREVAGSATAAVPRISDSGTPPPPTASSTAQPRTGPFADLAAHPLSSSTTRMPDTTCALPRFDPADDKQAEFYTAAKKCADDAWRPVLQAAGLSGEVEVVTVTGAVRTQSCGELAPTSAPTECDGTVYLAPAYLRDTEQLGRYPGKYFGIFLREYARGLQDTTGLDDLLTRVTTGSAADLDTRVDQQATCLAGVAGGAMAGRGAVDTNIVDEIHQRLTTVDAPPNAQALLDRGFQQRTPAACNTWAG
jgi:hypothetical protein